MSSIYKPKDKHNWYISFIDPVTGKTKNLSTKLEASKQNLKKAQEIKKKVDEYITKKKKEYSNLVFKKKTIKEAYDHFKKVNSFKNTKTLIGYDLFYKRFTESYDTTKPITIINKALSEEWLINIRKLNRSKNTIHNFYKVFRKFLNFLFEYEYLPVFVLNKDVIPKQEVKAILIFTQDDQNSILEHLDDKIECKTKKEGDPDKIKNKKTTNFKTMIYLLNYTGLRPSDIINIKAEDVDLENRQFNYYSIKTDQYFTVPFQEKLYSTLESRIKEVKEGRLLEYATLGEMGKAFRRYLMTIKLNGKGYNLRTFRKTFATNAFERDLSLVSAAALLGHKNISTTMKYYTKANRKKLAEELKKFNS